MGAWERRGRSTEDDTGKGAAAGSSASGKLGSGPMVARESQDEKIRSGVSREFPTHPWVIGLRGRFGGLHN
jgi:hypothetical protein